VNDGVVPARSANATESRKNGSSMSLIRMPVSLARNGAMTASKIRVRQLPMTATLAPTWSHPAKFAADERDPAKTSLPVAAL